MANARKKQEYTSAHDDRFDGFPPEAFDYDDDVSAEGVDVMRKSAQAVIGGEEWIVVDGFGKNQPAA